MQQNFYFGWYLIPVTKSSPVNPFLSCSDWTIFNSYFVYTGTVTKEEGDVTQSAHPHYLPYTQYLTPFHIPSRFVAQLISYLTHHYSHSTLCLSHTNKKIPTKKYAIPHKKNATTKLYYSNKTDKKNTFIITKF